MSCRVATFARNLETYDINICLNSRDIYAKPKPAPAIEQEKPTRGRRRSTCRALGVHDDEKCAACSKPEKRLKCLRSSDGGLAADESKDFGAASGVFEPTNPIRLTCTCQRIGVPPRTTSPTSRRGKANSLSARRSSLRRAPLTRRGCEKKRCKRRRPCHLHR